MFFWVINIVGQVVVVFWLAPEYHGIIISNTVNVDEYAFGYFYR